MIVKKRRETSKDIVIDQYSKWVHHRTVPDFQYKNVTDAKKDLRNLDFEVLTKEILIEGCEHYGSYFEVYIKVDLKNQFDQYHIDSPYYLD